MVLLPEISGPTCGGSPGVPSAAVSADISKVLPLRLSQVPLSDAVATHRLKKETRKKIVGTWHSATPSFMTCKKHFFYFTYPVQDIW